MHRPEDDQQHSKPDDDKRHAPETHSQDQSATGTQSQKSNSSEQSQGSDGAAQAQSPEDQSADTVGNDPLFDDVEDLRGSLSFEPGHTPVEELSDDSGKKDR